MESRNEHMLRSVNWLLDCSVLTTDDEKATLGDLYFDEEKWQLQYLIVSTGSWMHKREALLRFDTVRAVQDDEAVLSLSVSSKGIRESPDVNTTLPISREAELLLAKHWMWALPTSNSLSPEVSGNIAREASDEGKAISENATESRLRSVREVEGYSIGTPDGELGHLDDLLYDRDWMLRYAVADTRNWLPGKRVLLPIHCIDEVRWSERSLRVWPSRDLIREAPEYDPHRRVTKADADALQEHYACAKSSA